MLGFLVLYYTSVVDACLQNLAAFGEKKSQREKLKQTEFQKLKLLFRAEDENFRAPTVFAAGDHASDPPTPFLYGLGGASSAPPRTRPGAFSRAGAAHRRAAGSHRRLGVRHHRVGPAGRE